MATEEPRSGAAGAGSAAAGAVEGTLRVPVQPTESEAKVAAAARALFPDAELAATGFGLEGPAGGLDAFARAIREQRIPDTARAVLLRGSEGAATRFVVSKQAAAVGRLNFAAREGPLGDIAVELRAASEEALLAWVDSVAPDTRGWTLEARGLTERGLREQDAWESTLDELERSAGPGGGGEGARPPRRRRGD